MMFKADQEFANFRIIRKIGEGGMGEVYLAEDVKLNRQVALKILQAEFFDNPDRLERFKREAKTAARISHPNVMAIYDMDTARDRETGRDLNYIVMEYISGLSLTDYLQKKSLATSDILRVAEKVAAGLAAAHKLGIVHRDIKPDNIKIDEDGNPKILDFGLAKPVDLAGADEDRDTTNTVSRELTQEGKIIGTVNYMSPEQARGETVDTRSDIFAYGILLYRMLTGEFPFDGKDKVSIIAKILEGRHVPIRHKNETLPPELERIIDKCLQKNPDDRYQDTRDLVVDIRSLRRQYESGISDTTSIIRDKLPSGSKVFVFRGAKLLGAFVILVAMVLLIVLGGKVFFKSDPGTKTPLQARENTLAILNFENKTGDPELDWLQAGLPEILLTDLVQSGAGNIISRNRVLDRLEVDETTGASLPGHQKCIIAARALGATSALSGSFYRMGNKIRIDARLEEVESGKILLGEKVIGEDPFVLVDSLTHKIAQSLNIQLAMAGRKDITTFTSSSPEAYKYYIIGMEKFGLGFLDEAIEQFHKAVAIDSTFALPYMRIGMAYTFKGRNQMGASYFNKARQFEDKLPIKEKNLLDIYYDTWLNQKFDDAYIKLKSFVRNYPDDKEARTIYALFLSGLANNTVEALVQLDTVLMLDPQYPLALENIAALYAQQDDYEKAISYSQLMKKYYPESPSSYQLLSTYYMITEQFDNAIKECEELLRLQPNDENALELLVRIYIMKRDFTRAEKYAETIRKNNADDPYQLMTYYGIMENLSNWHGLFIKGREYKQKTLEQAYKTGDSAQVFTQLHLLASYYLNILKNPDSALTYSRKSHPWAKGFQLIGYAFLLLDIDAFYEPEAREILNVNIRDFKASLPQEMWSLVENLSLLFDGNAKSDTTLILKAYAGIMEHPNQVGSGDKYEYGKILVLKGYYEKGKEMLTRLIAGREATIQAYRYLLARYYIGCADEAMKNTDDAIKAYREVLKYWDKADADIDEIDDARERLRKLQS